MIRWLFLAFLVWLLWRFATRSARPRDIGSRGAQGWDPRAILGVASDASREEIARAYREQIKLYHPDRVSGMGPEIQRVAHEKTLAIQRAYEELSGES